MKERGYLSADTKIYPYKKTELEDLPGERWKDLPFLDGLCRISNLGRVKRLQRESDSGEGHLRRLPEKIIKCDLHRAKNIGVGDFSFTLIANVKYNRKGFKFSVPRLVFYCFIKKFKLEDLHFVVIAKDGNGKNIKLSNLQLTDISRKQKRVFERGRWIKKYETTFDEFKDGKIKSKNPYSKQVSQYNLKGKWIQAFPSIAVAAKVTGVRESNILSVLKKRTLTGGRFVWAYSKNKSVDVVDTRNSNLERRKLLVGRKVTQYDLKGKMVASYVNIKDASKQTMVNTSDIHAVLNGKQRSAGGYIWRGGSGKNKIDTRGFLTGEAWRAFRRQKKVKQFNSKGKIIGHFSSVNDAAKHMGIGSSSISIAISKGVAIKGTYWKFAR
jgi:hypothetical protein